MKDFYRLVLVLLCCVLILSPLVNAAGDAAAKLEEGKKYYAQKNYDAAMDSFVDVFVNGNSQQIAEANEYVNMIHFAMGGVDAPKKVDYDPELEKQRAAQQAQGRELFSAEDQQQNQAASKTAGDAPAVAEAAQAQAAQPQAALPQQLVSETIIPASELAKADRGALREMRMEAVNAQIEDMTAKIIKRLAAAKGVNVYMREGAVDAVDIKSDELFDANNNFKLSAKPVLDALYALMLVSGTPSFVLLPQGSYSDDVSIQAVRQAVALNSYLINEGISSSKITFNMGLTTEQPPAKFSNLEGISVVFDYTAQSNLKMKLADKDTPPVMSMGIYPFESLNPDNGEGMLVDFSVMEASSPVADWSLQIIQHNKDGKFYVVRQVSGIGAVYRQIFWNGRKQYFGEILPLGAYSIVLKAKDIDGREKIVRRKVVLTGNAPKGAKPVAAAAAAAGARSAADYKVKRLWAKPVRTAGPAANAAPVDNAQPAVDNQSAGYDPYAPVPAIDGQPYNASEAPLYRMPVMPSGYGADSGQQPASVNPIQNDAPGAAQAPAVGYPAQLPAEEVPVNAADYDY
ncbi:MAG: hypothetical protein LBL61_06415 [Elusimicrobiota bacterium]|jgi:hypothetical protein|nr:hypothetical protein [Elusimicrobiota bacterium]